MSDQKLSNNDAYNELLQSFSARANENSKNTADGTLNKNTKNSTPVADISFSKSDNRKAEPIEYNKKSIGGAAKKNENVEKAPAVVRKTSAGKTVKKTTAQRKNSSKKKKRRIKRLKSTGKSILLVILVLFFVFSAAFMLKMPIMGCVNDIIAMDRDSDEVSITVSDGMNIDDIIDLLASRGLIYSPKFCKLAAGILKYSKTNVYPEGTFELSPSMGLEGMLNEIVNAGAKLNTVKLTFPEGYTVDQIIAKLSENNVASADALYDAIEKQELADKYDFLVNITDSADRYTVFEGYMYPDTYEFFIGEDPNSVIEKFLNNFARRWTSEFDSTAEKLGMTVDEIITLASILEKEAFDAEQMPLIASILYNRIHSSTFPTLDCDSTINYLEGIHEHISSDERYLQLASEYNTYDKTGLPVGAICNPGADAIKAALDPESTDYYFFLHDPDGKIYVARTLDEHNNNMRFLG